MNHFEALRPELAVFADQIAEVLGTNFVGAYVFGSLATDAWNPQNSDIDLLIITEQLPETGEIARLERAHNYFSQSVTGSRLEGEYIDIQNFHAKNFDINVPSFNEGLLDASALCNLSVDNVLALREHGKVLRGRPVEELGLSVSEEEIRTLASNWFTAIRNELPRKPEQNLIDALRLIYLLDTKHVPTKRCAIEHSERLLPPELYRDLLNYLHTGISPVCANESTVRELVHSGIRLLNRDGTNPKPRRHRTT